MSLLDHAKTEMKAAGLYDKDADYGGMIPSAVEELVTVFANQGHSGSSAHITISLLTKLLRYEPLVPLSGKPDEWTCVCDERTDNKPLYQNKRCSHVFADGPNGENAWDIDGIIFREPDGCCFTNGKSHVKVTFPYTPKSEYVDVPKQVYETTIPDPATANEVLEKAEPVQVYVDETELEKNKD